MVKKTTIGLIQTKVFDNQNKNIENSVIKIKEAAKKKAKIICLPELFLSPYFCQSENHAKFKLAEKIPGRLSDIYCKLAKELSVVLMWIIWNMHFLLAEIFKISILALLAKQIVKIKSII